MHLLKWREMKHPGGADARDCPQCGGPVKQGVRMCTRCGFDCRSIDETTSIVHPPPTPPRPQA